MQPGLTACLVFLLALSPFAGAAAEEGTPSLEFTPSTDVVPQPRARERDQPRTLFTKTVGGFGLSRGSFDGPVDVAYDSLGYYYVLDAGNSRVQKFSDRDRFELTWGASGASTGRFRSPSAIAIDNEDFVYVVDTGNHRIQKFDTEGTFVFSWGGLGSTAGKFKDPVDIAFDEDGNIFILDSGNTRIQKFTASAEFEEEWGVFSGGRQGDFNRLVSIAYLEKRLGYLYLLGFGVEEGSCQVQRLTLEGGRQEVERVWVLEYPEQDEEPCHPASIEIDNRDDYVYILDDVNGVLRRFTLDGRYLDSIWEPEMPFSGPRGFAVQPGERQVWVADTGNNIVQRFLIR